MSPVGESTVRHPPPNDDALLSKLTLRHLTDMSFIDSANLQCAIASHDRLVQGASNNIAGYLNTIQQSFPNFYQVK